MAQSITLSATKSTLVRSFTKPWARNYLLERLHLSALCGKFRTDRRRRVSLTDEELFGPHLACGGCGEEVPEMFLRGGICPDCEHSAAFMARNGHPAC